MCLIHSCEIQIVWMPIKCLFKSHIAKMLTRSWHTVKKLNSWVPPFFPQHHHRDITYHSPTNFFFPLNKSFLDALNSASPSMSFSFSNLLKERSFAEPHEVISTKTILGAAAVCVRLLFLLSVVFDLWSLLRRRRKPISLTLLLTCSKLILVDSCLFLLYRLFWVHFDGVFITWGGGKCLMTKCERREWPGRCWAGLPCRSWWCLGP